MSPSESCIVAALIAASCFLSVSAQWQNSPHLLPRRQDTDPDCALYQDENAHMTFDRVCEVCHEMFRHQDPNFRAKCRGDCYENETFVLCLNMFSRNVEVGLATAVKRHMK